MLQVAQPEGDVLERDDHAGLDGGARHAGCLDRNTGNLHLSNTMKGSVLSRAPLTPRVSGRGKPRQRLRGPLDAPVMPVINQTNR